VCIHSVDQVGSRCSAIGRSIAVAALRPVL
jgi:hypothetical protein